MAPGIKRKVKSGVNNIQPLPPWLRAQGDGLLLSVKLQPRASVSAIGEPLGGELRVKVTPPPVDAAANQALVELLAEKLDCPRGCVTLVRGHTSRHKLIQLCRVLNNAELIGRFLPRSKESPIFHALNSALSDCLPEQPNRFHYTGPEIFLPLQSGCPTRWRITAITSPLPFLMKVYCAYMNLSKKFVSDPA